jgi:purine-binding chemotaxis protein CheW
MDITSIETNQYLTFSLADEQYAIEVTKVREVLEADEITRVPKMPPYMLGVINLRGSVVPVIDLRSKFAMEQTERTVDTSIIILEIQIEDEDILIGAFVDSVHEVIEIEEDQIEPAPKIGTKLDTEFISGMGKRDDQFIIIINIDKVFSQEELTSVSEGSSVLSNAIKKDTEEQSPEPEKDVKEKKE